jgi:type IVB pilus formation R64 PilN family outer membrane protein
LNALTIGSTGSGGSNAIVQALQQQGQVSMVTEPQVTTMNNQVAAIDITRSEGYLKSISSTANDVSTTTSLTPGDVTTGFTMYLLPKIRNNKVYMQISSSMADLIALDKADSSPNDASKSAGDKQGQDYSAIQVPTIDKKQFNQRSVVNNGATLVVAGYRTMNDKTETSKVFGLSALGARGAAHQRIETIILVTPIITRN